MQLTIRGRCKAIDREELKMMMFWFLRRIIRPRLLQNIDVTLEFKKNLNKKKKWKAAVAWMDTNHKPRRFHIEVDPKYQYRSLTDTLAHECWHIKQFVDGAMKDLERPEATKWYSKLIFDGDMTYRKLPWEVEARKQARRLVKEYHNQHSI